MRTVSTISGAIMTDAVDPTTACDSVDVVGSGLELPAACDTALRQVQHTAATAAAALSATQDTLEAQAMAAEMFSSFAPAHQLAPIGRRLTETVCESPDAELCQRFADMYGRIQSAKKVSVTAIPLAVLNLHLVGSGETVPAVKIDLVESKNHDVSEHIDEDRFRVVLGTAHAASDVDTQQLDRLVRNKLLQTSAYQQVSLSKRGNEFRHDLLTHRASQAAQMVTSESDRAEQVSTAQNFFDAKMRTYCHLALEHLVREIRAYEYIILEDFTGLNLDAFRRARMTGPQLRDFVVQVETDLQTAFINAESRFNNAGESLFAGVSFELAEMPTARQHFVESGELTLTIPLPPESNYYGVTFSDVRVFLVNLPSAGRTPITIDLVKAGVSDFKDDTGSTRRFTHDETNPPLRFTYEADRCTVISSSDVQRGNMEDVYIRYSPYGTWKLRVTNRASLTLDSVTAVYFEFRLQAKPGRFTGAPMFFTGGSLGELGTEACGDHIASPPPPNSQQGVDTSPTDGNVSPGGADRLSCSSGDEFAAIMGPVTDACCDDPVEDCPGGLPSSCDAECAAVLLPVQAACEDFLAAGGLSYAPMKAIIDTAASLCTTPLPACGSIEEFESVMGPVNEECCDQPSEDCSNGLPSSCNAECAALLLPAQAACEDFLAAGGLIMAPTKAIVDNVAAQCPRGQGEGH
eukprot:SAG31_NODE_3318_length_4420_cov_2.018051_4_plen_690_part_00